MSDTTNLHQDLSHQRTTVASSLRSAYLVKMTKYVVTGTTGGLGSQVFKYLLKLVPGAHWF